MAKRRKRGGKKTSVFRIESNRDQKIDTKAKAGVQSEKKWKLSLSGFLSVSAVGGRTLEYECYSAYTVSATVATHSEF
jgi:hypothetical protein